MTPGDGRWRQWVVPEQGVREMLDDLVDVLAARPRVETTAEKPHVNLQLREDCLNTLVGMAVNYVDLVDVPKRVRRNVISQLRQAQARQLTDSNR